MKKLILFCLVFLCLHPVFGELPRIAVVEIKATQGINSNSLTKYLRSEFTQKGKNKYRFVSSGDYQTAALKMQKKTQELYKNQKYRTEYGNLTSANLLLLTEIECEGNECTVYSTLINIAGEDIDSAHEDFQKNNKQSAQNALSRIVAYLVNSSSSDSVEANYSGDSEDEQFCRMARNDSDVNGWRIYKEKFPNGKCADEAEKALDKKGCEIAESKNTPEAWQKYLEKHPKGSCVDKANQILFKAKYEKAKELDRLKRWSKRSSNKMTWNSAKQYCENLTEGGYSDWRLPTIDELRTLIKNCPKTEPGGQCKVSEKNNCLSWKQCGNGRLEGSCSCEDKNNNGGYYSKLGDDDNVWLWSSSVLSDYSNNRWLVVVDFYDGDVGYNGIDGNGYVRCVR